MASFRKRNNPDENDEPLMDGDNDSQDRIVMVSVKDNSMGFEDDGSENIKEKVNTFEDIVPIVASDMGDD